MTPQAERFLEKAQKLLTEADTMLGAELNEAAGRTAYLASFHAAQALIFERTEKVLKTHSGVHKEFQRLTKDDARIDSELRAFLSRSYDLKTVADYETGPGADVSPERATAAVEAGKRFVAHIGTLIAADGRGRISGPTSG